MREAAPSALPLSLTPRQAELADAALEIVAREGMGALSFRAVAAEAGCSLGAIQKAFPTKERMIASAFARLRQTAAPLPPGEPGRPTLRAWLVELAVCILPLDAARAAAHRTGEAFAAHAVNDPAIAAAIAESDDHLRGLFASLVLRAQHEGEVSAGLPAASTAWGILAVLTGAAAQLSYQPQGEEEARALLLAAFGSLLGSGS